MIGRIIYAAGYISAAEKRAPGALITFVINAILILQQSTHCQLFVLLQPMWHHKTSRSRKRSRKRGLLSTLIF